MPLPHLLPQDTRGHPQPSRLLQTPTKTGPRSQTLPSAGGYRTVLLSATTARSSRRGLKTLYVLTFNPNIHWDAILTQLQERRAASSSASPEQKPAELQPPQTSPRQEFPSPSSSDSSYTTPPEDRMFSHQYTRQLSTSPPPFSVASYSSSYPAPDAIPYSMPYTTASPYHTIPTTLTPEMPSYTYLPPPLSSAYPTTLPGHLPSMKSEYYAEEDLSPFGVGYAAIGGIEIPPPHAYADHNAHVRLPTRQQPYSYA
jgi:hypothetical protein